MQIPSTNHYWLLNAHVPSPLLIDKHLRSPQDFSLVNIEIKAGKIAQILPSGTASSLDLPAHLPTLDLKQRQVWSCLVDIHTHLDKGHIWERSPNSTGTFQTALATTQVDRETYWQADDVYQRMEFGLKCSYAHGTQAIRTHLDSLNQQAEISFEVFEQLKTEWRDRLFLQAVCLVPLDEFLTPAGEKLADLVATTGNVLGGVGRMNPALQSQLDRLFDLAKERNLALDLHVDENGDPDSRVLHHVAQTALRHQFAQPILCGHCCSLAMQPLDEALETIALVKQAGISIVSLPMCNLYLQDRNQVASNPIQPVIPGSSHPTQAPIYPSVTPHWRGVTLLHELHHAQVPVMVASDNCRDPFYGFGDHDVLEVFTQAVRIAQLDRPYADWCRIVSTTPADVMQLPQVGRIGVGLPANLVIFPARYYSELLSRSQSDRIVIRQGAAIDTTLPDYAELDHLVFRDC